MRLADWRCGVDKSMTEGKNPPRRFAIQRIIPDYLT
jgi:hypothetical protein